MLHLGGGRAFEPSDAATQRLYEQQWFGQTPMTVLTPEFRTFARTMSPTGPDRWPGPPARLPKLFIPALAALSGARQQGWHQENPHCVLTPVWAHPDRFIRRPSVRTTRQQVNAGTSGIAVPAAYVPTSAANFYGGMGSY